MPVNAHVQRDQPPGVPPLELTGERTLPDVPAENYWFRRHLAVYEWIGARVIGAPGARHGLRRGLWLRGPVARRGERGGRRRQPRGARARAPALPPPEPDLRAGDGREPRRAAARYDAVVFLQTIEHVQDPEAVLAHFRRCSPPGGVAYISTPNLLTLAPPGAAKSDNPWHIKEYRAHEFDNAVPHGLRPRRAAGAVSRPQAAAARGGAGLRLGSPFTRGSGSPSPSTTGSRRRSRPATSRCGPTSSTARWTSWPSVAERCDASPGSGELALVLHTHMPYVEGFGTWPFGEEWLWEAIATCYLPLLDVLAPARAADPLAHAGPGRPAGATRARSSAASVPHRDPPRVPSSRHRR